MFMLCAFLFVILIVMSILYVCLFCFHFIFILYFLLFLAMSVPTAFAAIWCCCYGADRWASPMPRVVIFMTVFVIFKLSCFYL